MKKFFLLYVIKIIYLGGAFLSRKIIEKIGLPLDYFFVYEEDFEYGLRAIDNGFQIFQLYNPYIVDVDMNVNNRNDKFLSILLEEMEDFRIFYRIRNNAYLSYHLYKTNIIILYINFILALSILNFFFILKYGFKNYLIKRNKLIYRAFKKGLKKDFGKF